MNRARYSSWRFPRLWLRRGDRLADHGVGATQLLDDRRQNLAICWLLVAQPDCPETYGATHVGRRMRRQNPREGCAGAFDIRVRKRLQWLVGFQVRRTRGDVLF